MMGHTSLKGVGEFVSPFRPPHNRALHWGLIGPNLFYSLFWFFSTLKIVTHGGVAGGGRPAPGIIILG